MVNAQDAESDVDPYDAAAAREMKAQEAARNELASEITFVGSVDATGAPDATPDATGGEEPDQRQLWDRPYTRFHEVRWAPSSGPECDTEAGWRPSTAHVDVKARLMERGCMPVS